MEEAFDTAYRQVFNAVPTMALAVCLYELAWSRLETHCTRASMALQLPLGCGRAALPEQFCEQVPDAGAAT